MAITTSWDIEQLKYRTSDGYIYEVSWTIKGSETVETSIGITTYTADSFGTCPFEIGEKTDSYIELADLTKEQVLQWVWDSADEKYFETYHAELAKSISIAKGEDQDESVGLPEHWIENGDD